MRTKRKLARLEKGAAIRGLLVSRGENGTFDLFSGRSGKYLLTYVPWANRWTIGTITGPAKNPAAVLLLAEFVAARVDGRPLPASRARSKRKSEGVTV